MEIYQHDISDVLRVLPEVESLNFNIRNTSGTTLFIATLGFEERTHTIIDGLSQKGLLKDTGILLIKYPTNTEENEENLAYFERAAKQAISLDEAPYSRNEYSKRFAQKLDEIFERIKYTRIVFDVSTCSSYVFYPTIKELVSRDVDLHVVYSEAHTYYPTLDEWRTVAEEANNENTFFVEAFEEAGFQSLGVEDVYSLPLFSEMNPGNKPSALIAMPNFSATRMSAIMTRDREINKTSVDNIRWLIGEPPNQRDHWRIDAVMTTNNLQNIHSQLITNVSTLHYKEIIKTLEDIWLEKRYKYYLTVGTLGSKMQHLGTFLFLYLHKDMGLWVTEPERFQANRFSSGSGSTWQIRFGNTVDLRQTLDTYQLFKWKF